MANGAWTSTIEYDGGKFRFRVIYSETASSFNWSWECDVTKAPNSKRYLWVRWGEDSGGWSDWKHTDDATTKDYKSSKTRTVSRSTLKVQFGVGPDHAKTVSAEVIESTTKAVTPTSITVSKANDARYSIKVSGYGTSKTPTTSLVLERATDTQGSWSEIENKEINSSNSYSETFTDDTTEAGHKYTWRVKATSSLGDSAYITSSAEYTTPETQADMDVEEGSGFNTVVWSVDSVAEIDRGIIEGWYVRRSENGGAYQTIGTVYARASQYNYSYTDYDISNGSTYKYDIQSFGQGGESHESQEGGSEIATAPSKPISVKAYKNENDYVVINIVDSSSNTADKVLIERSIDGGDYTQIAEVDFPCDTYTDETAVGSDTIKYRVRNHNSKGYSAYTESNSVLLKSKPNPPSLLQPYNDTIQDVSSQPIRLVWMHNATDGSPQREAEIKVIVDGVENIYTATTQSYVEIAGFGINDSVEWTVRTKGSHADFSDWSAPYTFKVLKKPEILILSPQNSEVITTLPIVLEWLYNDLSGELKELTITLIKDNKEVAKYNADPTTSEYSLAGFLFENHSVYGIRVDALSTTGLKASQLISVVIEYEAISLEGGLLPTIVADENGYAYITIGRDITTVQGTLQDTKWELNEIPTFDLPSDRNEYDIDFNTKEILSEEKPYRYFNKMSINKSFDPVISGDYITYKPNNATTNIIILEYWQGRAYWDYETAKEITITGGDDVNNAELINWFRNNASIVPPEPIPIAEAYLYRVHDKERTLLGAVNEGTQIIDKYAPFNVDFEYELLQLTEDGRISLVTVTVNLPSKESFIYFGNGEIFKGKWNPKISNTLDRPERVYKQYSGKDYENVYDTKAKSEGGTFSCVLVDRKELVQLKDLMRSGHGKGIWKSVDGDCFDATFVLKYDVQKYYHNEPWEVSLDVKRIEKDGKSNW